MKKKLFALNLLTGYSSLFFERFLPSVEHLVICKDIASFCVSFQAETYTKKQIKQAVSALCGYGFEVRHRTFSRSDYVHPANQRAFKMGAMRNTVSSLSPESLGYMMLDDDMIFKPAPGKSKISSKSSGEKYMKMFRYMEEHSECGVIESKGYLGGSQQGHKIIKVEKFGHPATNRGLLIRNIFNGCVIPNRIADKYYGPTFDWICSLLRIEKGYYYAKQMNNPTIHRERNQVGKEDSAGIWVLRDIFNNNYLKFAKGRYGEQIEYKTILRPGEAPYKSGMYYKIIDELHRKNKKNIREE